MTILEIETLMAFIKLFLSIFLFICFSIRHNRLKLDYKYKSIINAFEKVFDKEILYVYPWKLSDKSWINKTELWKEKNGFEVKIVEVEYGLL